MSIEIERVEAGRQLSEFVNLPFILNQANSPWIPPLKKQEAELLSPGRHPFWETASRELFLARRDGRALGRIAAIVDRKYNDYAGEKCGAFGFFECAEDYEAAHALLNAAKDWLCQQKMDFMRGPFNPSANYSCGLLVDGFDLAPAIMMPWNPPFYASLLESWRMRKEQDLFAYLIRRRDISRPDWLMAEIRRLKEEKRFAYRSSSKATLAEDVRAMLEIYRQSWADNWGFSPLSQGEARQLVKELSAILNPDLFILFFHEGKPVAGMVALPDMNPLLKKLNGKMGLLAPWHYLRSREEIRRGYRIMLFGILPAYRLRGLPLLLFDDMMARAESAGFEWVEGSWVLEDNAAIDDLIEDFGGHIAKRYRIYRRDIAPCP